MSDLPPVLHREPVCAEHQECSAQDLAVVLAHWLVPAPHCFTLLWRRGWKPGAQLCEAFPTAVHQVCKWTSWQSAASATVHGTTYSCFCASLSKGIIYWAQLVSLSVGARGFWCNFCSLIRKTENMESIFHHFLQSFFQYAVADMQLSFQLSGRLPPGQFSSALWHMAGGA